MPPAFPCANSRFTVAVVGGGASGIAAACALAAAVRERRLDVRVILIEKGRRLGSSILRSGNGRCNFSHANIDAGSFWHPGFVKQAFAALEQAWTAHAGRSMREYDELSALFDPTVQPNAVLRWLAGLGLVWSVAPQSEGLLYPLSNKATSVLEVLQAELDRCGVEQYCGIDVQSISRSGSLQGKDENLPQDRPQEKYRNGFWDGLQKGRRFSLRLAAAARGAGSAADSAAKASGEQRLFEADMVIYAGGGGAASSCDRGVFEQLEKVSSLPVLGPLRTETRFLEGLDGVRVRARLACPKRSFCEEGEVLFRSYGVSGIVVFNASRFVNAGDVVALDLVPELSKGQLKDILTKRARAFQARTKCVPTYAQLLRGLFLPELARLLIEYADTVAPDHSIALHAFASDEGIDHLAECIKGFELRVVGHGDEKQCQVMRGGIRLDDIDPNTMEARCVPGLFVIGEALDIDGPCGGYNLHWAWASGLLAALSAARIIRGSVDNVPLNVPKGEQL